jgi:hypothetical protein
VITREQVADLREGDVVEVAHEDWPEGTVVRGPLWLMDGETLQVARIVVRHWDGRHPFDTGLSLTVISRAPRPLYVNHPRTEPVAGDVVRDADSNDPLALFIYVPDPGEAADDPWPWLCTDADWKARRGLPARLRLLVDGETGQVVPGDPSSDPLAHIAKGDPTPEGADEDKVCAASFHNWSCTRTPGHVGQHIAGCGLGNSVAEVWS